tara:strand:- start:45396 stop:45545 length:150 start_codon:yes stop_codon:yes gene_type:complete
MLGCHVLGCSIMAAARSKNICVGFHDLMLDARIHKKVTGYFSIIFTSWR